MYNYFTEYNTEGYNQEELNILNQKLDEKMEDIDEEDDYYEQLFKYHAERIISRFETQKLKEFILIYRIYY